MARPLSVARQPESPGGYVTARRIAEKTADMAVRITPKFRPFVGRIAGDEVDMSFARCAEARAALTL